MLSANWYILTGSWLLLRFKMGWINSILAFNNINSLISLLLNPTIFIEVTRQLHTFTFFMIKSDLLWKTVLVVLFGAYNHHLPGSSLHIYSNSILNFIFLSELCFPYESVKTFYLLHCVSKEDKTLMKFEDNFVKCHLRLPR